MTKTLVAVIVVVLTLIVVVFQLGLALGMPWGAASMAGKFPGRYPKKMRFVALLNVLILSILALIVLLRLGLFLPDWFLFSKKAIWLVVLFYLAGTLMNAISPSKVERVWVPLALLQFVISFMLALGFWD